MARIAPALFVLAMLALPARADDASERLQFPAGQSEMSVKGAIKGYDGQRYLIAAKAGQTLSVDLATANTATYFNVWGPGKTPGNDTALFAGDVGGNAYQATLADSGDYMVQVYLYRAAARRNESSQFTVHVKVTGSAAATAPAQDYADGLSGGPDFWEVTGLAGGRLVNLRRAPSTASAVVARLANGVILRNKGCRMEAGERWCSVERRDAPAAAGWIAGNFLREASAGADAAPSGDALVPGTQFHAVGSIPCTIARQPTITECVFGVTRGSPGVATVSITRPGADDLVLVFDNGKVAPQQPVEAFAYTRDSDNTIVTIDGGRETYSIFDAVIYGG